MVLSLSFYYKTHQNILSPTRKLKFPTKTSILLKRLNVRTHYFELHFIYRQINTKKTDTLMISIFQKILSHKKSSQKFFRELIKTFAVAIS